MRKAWLLTLLFLFCTVHYLASQNWNRIHMLDQDAEIMIMNKLYAEAADNYIRILRELPGNANIKYRIGYSFLYAEGRLDDAIAYLEKAAANSAPDADVLSFREERAPAEAWLLLGKAFQRSHRFNEAAEAYYRYRTILPEGDPGHHIAHQYAQSIDNARKFMGRPYQVTRENLGRGINSNEADVNAVISGDGQTMAFTRISKRGFDVFVARKRGNDWGRPVNISRQLRRDFLMTTGISYNGNELYLVYYVPDGSDIFTSTFENGEWSRARNIGRPVNSRNNETHATISADGSTLYFTSDRPGGYGGLDIYTATLDSRGRWRDVENLGPVINTYFNEETPFVTSDGRFLFFSSEGHNSMGGYDVFYVDLKDPSVVHNLGYPINNTGDNLFWFPVDDGRSGYTSFYDPDGIGRRDIIRLDIEEPAAVFAHLAAEEPPVQVVPAETVAEVVAEPAPDPVPHEAGAGDTETDEPAMEFFDEQADDIPDEPFYDFDPEAPGDIDYRPASVLPVHIPEGRSYSVQFLALQEPVSSEIAGAHPGAIIHYDRDGINRLITGYYSNEAEALPVLMQMREQGYPDAFIRINNYIPRYTIQLLAMENYIDGSFFGDIGEVMCLKGDDGIYRYTYGHFSDRAGAEAEAGRLRELGYTDLFIKRIGFGEGAF